jgi:hypothetical protein
MIYLDTSGGKNIIEQNLLSLELHLLPNPGLSAGRC